MHGRTISERWMATLVGLGALTLVLGAAVSACAQNSAVRSTGTYSVALEDASGRTLRAWDHAGDRFALGVPGDRYNIRIRNHTARRVEAVVSVDGRDVLTGEVGDYVHGRGYVLAPYGTVLIEGFRTSFERVAAFRFTRPGDSYSARMGTPENVGVIGVAFFPERTAPRPRDDIARPTPRAAPRSRGGMAGDAEAPKRAPSASSAESAPAGEARRSRGKAGGSTVGEGAARYEAAPNDAAGASMDNLGTAYAEQRESYVREVRFVRAHTSRPALLLTLRYDDREGLLARGIRVDRRPPPIVHHRPQAFPSRRFAPPPPPR